MLVISYYPSVPVVIGHVLMMYNASISTERSTALPDKAYVLIILLFKGLVQVSYASRVEEEMC